MTLADRHILLVEDDPDAAALMRRALEKADSECAIRIMSDGEQAIEYLSGRMNGQPLPLLVITDLKMPRKTGFDLIAWMRSQPSLTDVPVMVMSSSSERADIDRAMNLGANAYFEKPIGLPDLIEIARIIMAGKAGNESKR